MTMRRWAAVAAFCLLVAGPVHGQLEPGFELPADVPLACRVASNFFEDAAWPDRLVNPILRTPAEILTAVEERRRILACLESLEAAEGAPEWMAGALHHARLFLAFLAPGVQVNPLADPALELVDLARAPDAGVLRLRRDLGLAPPEGFVFVRYFARREEMPAVIRAAFERSEVQAVMAPPRYVAVLAPPGQNPAEAEPRGEALQALVSHELVHAFLDAGLGWRALRNGFPRWFHEGMAVHFSGSSRSHVLLDPLTGARLRIEPTAAYEQYARVFVYLESTLGPARFHELLRRVVEDVDPAPLLDAVGAASSEDLVQRAETWWRWWPVPVEPGGRVGLALLASILAVSALWVAIRRWRPVIPQSALEVQINRDLIDAVRASDIRTVRELLRSGADPDAADADGWSVLAWAVWLGHTGITEVLLDAGADPSRQVARLAEAVDPSEDMIRLLAEARTRRDR